MNYQKIYDQLIQKRRESILQRIGDFTVECHHILPRSCGGTNDKINLVDLTLREHYIAHLLLVKIAEQKHDEVMMSKMCKAVFYLVNGRKKKTGIHITSRIYEALKTKIIPSWIGRHHSIKSRQKTRNTMIKNGITGKRTWLNKNGIVKYVLNSKVDEFIKNGWEHGRPGYKPRKGMHGRII